MASDPGDLVADDPPQLRRNLGVLGGCLSIRSSAPHRGLDGEAVMCVEPHRLEVQAALMSAGHIAVFAEPAGCDALSRCIKDWITAANSGYVGRAAHPANVTLRDRADRPAAPSTPPPQSADQCESSDNPGIGNRPATSIRLLLADRTRYIADTGNAFCWRTCWHRWRQCRANSPRPDRNRRSNTALEIPREH